MGCIANLTAPVAALGAIEAPPRYWKAIVPAPPLWAFLRWPSSLPPLDHCIVRGNRKRRGSRIDPVRREYRREPFDAAGTDNWRQTAARADKQQFYIAGSGTAEPAVQRAHVRPGHPSACITTALSSASWVNPVSLEGEI